MVTEIPQAAAVLANGDVLAAKGTASLFFEDSTSIASLFGAPTSVGFCVPMSAVVAPLLLGLGPLSIQCSTSLSVLVSGVHVRKSSRPVKGSKMETFTMYMTLV